MKKLIIILGVLSVSLSAVFVRYSNAPSMALVFYRVLFASLLLLPPVLIRQRGELVDIGARDALLCGISGVFLGLHFYAYFEALRFTSIASAVALVDAEVFFVALFSAAVLGQRLGKKAWLGIALTFAGSVVIASGDAGGGSALLKGDALAVLGALCMSVYTMLGASCRKRVSTGVYTLIVYAFAAVTALAILLLTKTPVSGYSGRELLLALGMAVFCTLLGHSVFSWGLKYEPAPFVATAKLLEPVFAWLWGALFFKELPSFQAVCGGLLVIAGVAVYSLCAEKARKVKASGGA